MKWIKTGGKIKKGVLTNKGTVINICPAPFLLWITDTLIEGKCIDSETDVFRTKELFTIKIK